MMRALLLLIILAWGSVASATPSSCPGKFIYDEQPDIEYDEALCFAEFAVLYSHRYKAPLISAERLTVEKVRAAEQLRRRDTFHVESTLPIDVRSTPDDYQHSGYDQGHMTPAGNMPDSHAQYESFSMANITPQLPILNRIAWRRIETSVRQQALLDGEIWVVTGALFSEQRIGGGVAVPMLIYKAVYGKSGQHVFVGNNQTGEVTLMSLSDFTTRYHIMLINKGSRT